MKTLHSDPTHQQRHVSTPRALCGVLNRVAAFATHAALPDANALQKLNRASVPFVPNAGQWDERAAFAAQTLAGTVFVTRKGELIYSLPGKPIDEAVSPDATSPIDKLNKRNVASVERSAGWSLNEQFVDRNHKPLPATAHGFRPQSAKVSYFIGADESKHQRGLNTYERVNLGDIYPGINVQVRATGNNIEKIFTVAPEQDPAQIQVKLSGATKLEVNPQGELIAHTDNGPIAYTAPIAFQEDAVGNKESVAVQYVLNAEQNTYGFTLAAYDARRPLIIDPLIKSSYLGAAGTDVAFALAIHPATGEVYVAGYTDSPDTSFPGVSGGAQGSFGGVIDAFVSRFSADLTGSDTTPDAFAFITQANVPVATVRTSNPALITGIVGAAGIYVDGAFGSSYCVSSGNNCSCDVSAAFISAPSTVANNQFVCARHTSAAALDVATRTNVHIGGAVGKFSVSTGTAFTAACNLDMDGDTLLTSSKEWLVLLRASLGFTGAATTAGTGITAAQWNTARPLINANCGTNFGS